MLCKEFFDNNRENTRRVPIVKTGSKEMREKVKMIDQLVKSKPQDGGNTLPFSLVDKEKYGIGILNVKDIIDNTTNEIFISYKEELLSEPITYIIPAVWGEKEDGSLSGTQDEINKRITPMIDYIMEILELEGINKAQRFAIGYLIRGLMVSKITYLIEAFRNNFTPLSKV